MVQPHGDEVVAREGDLTPSSPAQNAPSAAGSAQSREIEPSRIPATARSVVSGRSRREPVPRWHPLWEASSWRPEPDRRGATERRRKWVWPSIDHDRPVEPRPANDPWTRIAPPAETIPAPSPRGGRLGGEPQAESSVATPESRTPVTVFGVMTTQMLWMPFFQGRGSSPSI